MIARIIVNIQPYPILVQLKLDMLNEILKTYIGTNCPHVKNHKFQLSTICRQLIMK